MPEAPTTVSSLIEGSRLKRPEAATGFLLWRVSLRYVREVDRVCAGVDLTHLQFAMLALAGRLAREGQSVSQTMIAETSDIHPMQVSAVLKMLEGKTLIVRSRGTTDGRLKLVDLTPAGLEALKRAIPLVERVQIDFFGAASSGEFHDGLAALDRRTGKG